MGISAAVLLVILVRYSRFGRAMRATAQNPRAARIMGIDTRKVYAMTFALNGAICGVAGSIVAFVYLIHPFQGLIYTLRSFVIVILAGAVAAFFIAIAGGLYGSAKNFIDPTEVAFSLPTVGVWMLLMTLIWGKGTIWGPIVGAVIFQVFKEFFWTFLFGWQRVALGLLIVIIVVFFPGGVMGGRDRLRRMLGFGKPRREAGIAYILQDNSVFPDMTVRENLLMGGYLMATTKQAAAKVDELFDKYDRLAVRANQPARILSGGERRLLEISRALVMDPEVLLVDEPSIGLEPRYIEMVFGILENLQRKDGKTIIMVEQNARKGLEFADLGYVLVAGELALADKGDALLANPEVGRLFLGG